MSPSRLADTLVVIGLVVTVGISRGGPTILRAASDVWRAAHTVIAERIEATFEATDTTGEGFASIRDLGVPPVGGPAPGEFDACEPTYPPPRDPHRLSPAPSTARERSWHVLPRHDTRRNCSTNLWDLPPEIVFVPPAPFPGPPACYPGPLPWAPCDPWGRPEFPFHPQ